MQDEVLAPVRRYGFSDDEWMSELRLTYDVLIDHAVQPQIVTVSYWELTRGVCQLRGSGLPLEMGDPAKWQGLLAMIDWVSTRSWLQHGVMLGALVTSGDSKYPCTRTFDLAVKLGAMHPEYASDEDARLSWWYGHLNDVQTHRRTLRRARRDRTLLLDEA
jgi:hypothetical protein